MRFIAFDLETTGFAPEMDCICELGAVRFMGGQVESEFSTLIDPQRPIPAQATRVNGITNDMVRGKPSLDVLLEPLTEFCGDDLLVAHNANFDFQFLEAQVKRLHLPAPRGLVIDTLPIARKLIPGLPNYKLGTLVQHLKIPSSKFHRASDDAAYCGHVFQALVYKMQGRLQMPEPERLVSLTKKPPLRFTQLQRRPKQHSLLDL